jgi:fumarylpyruvate hydrolase
MELVVAIGKAGLRIAEAGALNHVYGYACGLDMTRRDLQAAAKEQRRPWDLGKDFEQAAVLSEIVAAADVAPPTAGRIELRVNGATRQASDLALLIHPVPAVIAHLSRYYRLQPGDLIYTGTPEGVGPVGAGDVLEGSIEGIGSISLTIGPAE